MFKRLFSVVLLLLLTTFSFSQNRGAALNVFSEREPFFLYVNDILYNKDPLTKIRIENIPNYTYDIRVEFESKRRNKAVFSRLQMFNELGQALDITLVTGTYNKLILFSLFPIGIVPLNTHSFPTYFYDNPRIPEKNQDGYIYYDDLRTSDFQNILDQIKRESFDKDKLSVALLASHNSSLSVSQIAAIMKEFSWDEGKLSFAESQFDNCLNKGSYLSLLDLFTFQSSKDKFIEVIKRRNRQVKYPTRMSQNEFDVFLKQVKGQSFDKDKTDLISSYGNSVSFTILEIKSVLKAFSFDEERLKAAKLMYPTCSDKQSYYTLAENFTFESSKRELQNFLRVNLTN